MLKFKIQNSKFKTAIKNSKSCLPIYTLAFSILPLTLLTGCKNQPLYKEKRLVMGTFAEVISPDRRAAKIAFEEIGRLENLMSKYKPDSEISRLNKFSKLKCSQDTYYILKKSGEFWQETSGAFDITIAPLMDLWGFTEKKYHLPQPEEVKAVLKLVGFEKIDFNSPDYMVKFKIPGMKIDLGAIAKGYAVDCAVRKIKKSGIQSCLINLGGNIYCLGKKLGRPWSIAIKNPRGTGFISSLELEDKAVATSGDYEQYFVQNNKRYSHIFNPRTGYPAESGVISVTVIALDALTADALSTSIFVLGKEKGMELVKKFLGVTVKIIEEK